MVKTQTQHNMKNVAFDQLKKNILSDSCFYVNPIEATYKDVDKKNLKNYGKMIDTAVYIIVMYTFSMHYNKIDPKIATVIESWIEKKVDFDWTSLNFQDILPLFIDVLFLGKRDTFSEKYLDDLNLESAVTGDEKHLEIGSYHPCKDSFVCVSQSCNWRDMVYYLFLIAAGKQSQAIIYSEGELWSSITDNYSAIKIKDSSRSVNDLLHIVNSALQHLTPEGYVILECDAFDKYLSHRIWSPKMNSIESKNHKSSDEACFFDELSHEDIIEEKSWYEALFKRMKEDKEFDPTQPIELFKKEDDQELDIKRKIRDVISKLVEDKLLHAVVRKNSFDELGHKIRLYIAPEAKGVYLINEKSFFENIKSPFCDKLERQFINMNLARNIDLITYIEHLDLNLKSGENLVKIKDILEAISPIHIKGAQGRLFKYQNMSTGYDNWERKPEELDIENVSGEFIRATEPVCVLNQNLKKPVMTYLLASENEPVYIGKQFMVFKLKETFIRPDYFYHIVFNGEFSSCISDEQMDIIFSYQGGLYQVSEAEWKYYDDPGISSKLSSSDLWLKIPSEVKIQERIFASAKTVWNVMEDKIEVQQAEINELEWLNEDHIRNIKHKIHGDLGTVKRDFLTLNKAFERNKGQLKLCDKFSSNPDSKRTVEDALGTIMCGLNKAIGTVAELTEVAKKKKEINIYEFYSEYVANTHYANQCDIQFSQCAKNLNIIIDPEDLVKVTDLFIENAIRHGKLDEQGTGLKIRMGCKDLFDGQCLIALENNGKKMSPLAKKIYFTRGGYAGETGNTGQGGADIKRAIESNGGKVDLDRNVSDDAEYPVCLMINFPVSNF